MTSDSRSDLYNDPANFQQGHKVKHGRPKAPPGDAKCVTEIRGRENTEVGGGAKFKFSQLILRKIIKIVATRCHIGRLKCTEFDFGWGYSPNPADGAHSAPPDPLADLRGPTSKEEQGREREKGRERKGEGKVRGRLRHGC